MADRGRKKRRKRKDSTTNVKPPLDFIESPLDGRKYFCTPVQAARRPFMATSLPVDEEEAKKWVSPQFPTHVEDVENLLGPRKKSRVRRKKQEDFLKSTSKESNSNKHNMFAILQFENETQGSKSKCKETDSRREISCRRSQRLRLRELKRNHFLFHASQATTPVNKQGDIVLAYETPDQELITLATRRQPRTNRGKIT